MEKHKIALFGGSFDPVHAGHLYIAGKARDACGLDEVVFLPCACSPLKTVCPRATDEQRMDMLHLAVSSLHWARVDGRDLQWPAPSWSWRVAEDFHETNPDAELYWLMGEDQWEDLMRWNRWEYLASLVTFIVHHRGGAPHGRAGIKAVFIEGSHPASASVIRLNPGTHLSWLSPEVQEYIRSHHLYK